MVFTVRCAMIVLLDYLHYERDESLDKNVPTFTEVAPLFKKVYKLLTEISLTVMVLEEFE